MAWRLLVCAALAVCVVSLVLADTKTAGGDNKTSPHSGNAAPNTKLDDPPNRPNSKDARYYVGRYAGSCGGKGMYYKDQFSFVICQHRIRHIQRCPAGTSNHHISHFRPRSFYDVTPFCSINLNDYGYTVSRSNALALQQRARHVSTAPSARAARGRKAPHPAPPGADGRTSGGYQLRPPVSKQPAAYGGPAMVKGAPIGPHVARGRSREARAAEWAHKDPYSKYPKHTKKDLSFGRHVEALLEEASSERRGPSWGYEDSPQYHSTEYGAYSAERSAGVHAPRYQPREANKKPSRFTETRPVYADTKGDYSASYELPDQYPRSREASYSRRYHRHHSYEARKEYPSPAKGAPPPSKHLIKGSNRPLHHDHGSSVKYPIYLEPPKSNSVRRRVDNSHDGDYYGKRLSQGLSAGTSGSRHSPRDSYRSSDYKSSREWSTDKLYSHESHSEEMYPPGSYKGDNHRSGPTMNEQYRKHHSPERRFSSIGNEYEPPQYKDSPFLGGEPELNSFENSIFGVGDFQKQNSYNGLPRKGSYPKKLSKWDTYPVPNYDKPSPYSGMANTRHGAKTGHHLPPASPLFESHTTKRKTDTFNDKLLKGNAGKYLPKKPDDLDKWLTDLSDIESKYSNSDLSFQNSDSAQQSMFNKRPQSKELRFDASFDDKTPKDFHHGDFAKSIARSSPPKKSEAEWNNWLKDLSDIEQRYGDNDQSFQRSSSSEIHAMGFGREHQRISSDATSGFQGSSNTYGDSGKSIPAGKSAEFEEGFGSVNGSEITHSDKDWSQWLTDLSDIAPQYGGPRDPPQVTEATSVELGKNNIKYNPFKGTEKTDADWDNWLKDPSDMGPMVKRKQERNQEPRLTGAKKGADQGIISGFVQSSQSMGRSGEMPKLAFKRADRSSIGNVKVNPGFGNNYKMQHIRPQGKYAARNILGNKHQHGNARSTGNDKFNPSLRNNAINLQQNALNNNPRSGTPLVHTGHSNANIPVRSSPLHIYTGEQNTQTHGRPNIPPSTDYSKIQSRRTRAMRPNPDSGGPANNAKIDGAIGTPSEKDTASSKAAGGVKGSHGSSHAPVIMNRMFNGNRYGNEGVGGSVRRQVRPLVGIKLHQLLTTPVYDDLSSGVTGQRIVLSAV